MIPSCSSCTFINSCRIYPVILIHISHSHQKNHTATLSSFDSPCIGQRNADGTFVADSGLYVYRS